MRLVFSQAGEWKAKHACYEALTTAGFSYGQWQAQAPCGALYGLNHDISKWRNLSEADRAALHASFSGDGRNGPIILTIHPTCPLEGLKAIERHFAERESEVA